MSCTTPINERKLSAPNAPEKELNDKTNKNEVSEPRNLDSAFAEAEAEDELENDYIPNDDGQCNDSFCKCGLTNPECLEVYAAQFVNHADDEEEDEEEEEDD